MKPKFCTLRQVLCLAGLSGMAGLSSLNVLAQTTPEAPRAASPWPTLAAELADGALRIAQLTEETAAHAQSGLAAERVVKGAPYCADATHETVQPLTDGNRIVRSQTTRLCRDGEGRTRQELSGRDGRKTVYLRDPVSKENWVLDPQARTARKLGPFGPLHGMGVADWHFDGDAFRDFGERARAWARQLSDNIRAGRPTDNMAAPLPPAPPVPGLIAPRAEGDGRRREVEVIRVAPGSVEVPMPPAVGLRAQFAAPRGPGVVTPLPAREIEGLKVHGERTTWTIEAGKIGNEKPIVITREVWSSPELVLTVATRDNDPRSGEVNYRLANLKRGEPDPALMKPPADYAVRERSVPSPAPAAPRAPVAPTPAVPPAPPAPLQKG